MIEGPYWEVRTVISCRSEGDAARLVEGIRAKQRERQTLTRVTRRFLDVVLVRHTMIEYAADGHSALMHALQLVWNTWPEGFDRPMSMTTKVRYQQAHKAAA